MNMTKICIFLSRQCDYLNVTDKEVIRQEQLVASECKLICHVNGTKEKYNISA